MKSVVVLVLTVLLSGCLLQSDVPMRSDDGVAFDMRILGVWRREEVNGVGFLHIGAVGAEGKAISVDHDNDGKIHSEENTILSACIPGGCYISVLLDKEEGRPYAILRYELMDDGALHVQYPNTKYMKAAMSSGVVQGEFKKGIFESAELHATETELRQFLSHHGSEAFSTVFVEFRKIQ